MIFLFRLPDGIDIIQPDINCRLGFDHEKNTWTIEPLSTRGLLSYLALYPAVKIIEPKGHGQTIIEVLRWEP